MTALKALAETCPLSCVEQYFLAWAAESGIREGLLYGRSFAPFQTIWRDFVTEGAAYANYRRIERVMDTAERYGLVSHTAVPEFRPEAFRAAGERGDLALMRVNASFFADFARKPWREDHYVRLMPARKGFAYLNQYPLGEGALTESQAGKAFGGTALFYRREKGGRTDEIERDFALQADRILCSAALRPPDASDNRTAVRDCLGVLKITRRRVRRWLAYLAEEGRFKTDRETESFFDEYLSVLDRLYLSFGAAAIRGRPPVESAEAGGVVAGYEVRMAEILEKGRSV